MLMNRIVRGSLPALILSASVSASGAFDAPVSYELGGFLVSGVTIGDIDGDGLADVAAANGTVALLFGDGSGLEPVQYVSAGPGEARYVAIEDIDDDGDRDLVVLVRNGDHLVVVLRNQGNGSFATPEPYGVPDPQSTEGLTWALRLADMDQDGDPDAVLAGGFINPSIIVLRNDGSGAFERDGSYLLATAPFVYVTDIDVADFNDDNYPDVAGVAQNTVAVLLNGGPGDLRPPAPVDLGQQFPAAVLARDVNGDGRPDLLVAGNCSAPDGELRVGLNDGAGGFALSDIEPLIGACHSITNPLGLASGHLDNDAVLDVVYASRSSDSIRLLRGAGDGTFEASEILPTDPGPVVVVAGDVNGDDSHDVISGSSPFSASSSDTVVLMANLGGPSVDTDGDTVANAADNCTEVANPDQRDTDDDGFGNLCDPDLNNDGVVNPIDLGIFRAMFFATGPGLDGDFDGDEVVNPIDLGILRSYFFMPPGPSGIAP